MNELHLADNIDLLRTWFERGMTNFIDLIYIDPPFNSNRNYNIVIKSSDLIEKAFDDIWSTVSYLDELQGISTISPHLYNFLSMLETTGLHKSYISYLTHMSVRCWYMKQMLKDTGSFYYHCDPTMSHYVKIMLDYIFGISNFRNEIVWCYSNSGRTKTSFPSKHDIILYYSKKECYKFNPQIINVASHIKSQYPLFDEENKMYYRIASRGKAGKYKEYARKLCEDWWIDINSIGGRNKTERLGYPTQKPEKLLERIILASSNEGDLIADFFLGGGTTIAVADRLKRRFIGTDINSYAIHLTQTRLESMNKIVKKDFVIHAIPNSADELRQMVDSNIIGKGKNSKFELEDITVKYYLRKHNVIGNDKKVGDNSIDGYFNFTYNGKERLGLVQVTTGAGINHLKAFCSEIGKNTGEVGVYVTFKDKITNGMIREVKSYGKIGHVDKIQILSFEDLIDNKKSFELPQDVLKI